MTKASPWVGAALFLVLLGACSHVVMIKTTPPGATVRIDGQVQGVTPLMFEEATGFSRRYQLELELDGYQIEKLSIQQDQWWHSCFWPSLCLMPFTLGVSGIGILFSRSLRDDYHYLLRPLPTPAVLPDPVAPSQAASDPGQAGPGVEEPSPGSTPTH